jgi:hypothetical protein
MITVVVLLVVLLTVVVGGVVLGFRSRVGVPSNAAVVRSGWGGVTVVSGSSKPVLCLPLVHKCHVVPFVSKTLSLEIAGDDYATTHDRVTVTCRADVTISSLRDQASVLAQCASEQTGRGGTSPPDTTLLGKCTAGVKRILFTRNFDELSESLVVDDPEGLRPMSRLLAPQAYSVDSVVIDAIRMFETGSLDSTNVAHQETIRRRRERDQLERKTAMEQQAQAAGEALEQQINQSIADEARRGEARLASLEESQQQNLAILSRRQSEAEDKAKRTAATQTREVQDQVVEESRNAILADDKNERQQQENKFDREGTTTEAKRARTASEANAKRESSVISESNREKEAVEEMDRFKASSLQEAETRRERELMRNSSESEQEVARLESSHTQALHTRQQKVADQHRRIEEAHATREEASQNAGLAQAEADRQVTGATEGEETESGK